MGGRPFSDEEQRHLSLALTRHWPQRATPIQPDARVEQRQERQLGSRAKCPSSIKRTLQTRRDLWCLDRYTSVSLP